MVQGPVLPPPSNDAGGFEFVIAEDRKTSQGKWCYGFDRMGWRKSWNGTRIQKDNSILKIIGRYMGRGVGRD
jgi:hypothetical protein